ncbi:helix-turn-helix domain-containing protein [Thermomonospora umbrina]|uniref:AraC family transcriptional regulator n=1 Tax=Thermomonospora umbrina TaxID=111806 RepID=A0A3D9T312_9ACTN|nr:AraC family transcriptional regulator [Thermomonospora umbrina]REE99635.1 AraC family transcriptional regulator [Thermomonospora umbrina]
MTATVHRYGGDDLGRTERTWGALRFALARWRVDGEAEGLTRRSEHQLFVTLPGSGGWTVAELEGERRHEGPECPGATTFIPGSRRRWSHYEGEGIAYASIRLDPDVLGPLEELPAQVDFIGFTNRPDPFVHHLVHVLAEETRRGEDAGDLFADGVAGALMLHLLRRHSDAAPRALRRPTPPMPGAVLRRVLEHLHDNLGEDLRIATLADLAGVDRYRFGRCFKAATGLSPHRYVLERRLERAAGLLRADGRRPIADIAHQVGFSSQSHLTTAFRRRYGTTPHAYRREVTA